MVFVPVHDFATNPSSLFQQNTSGSDERCLCHWFNIFVAIAPVLVRQNVKNQSLVGGKNLSESVAKRRNDSPESESVDRGIDKTDPLSKSK